MNTIRAINVTKQILLISFVFFLSCKKQTEVTSEPQKTMTNNAFFSREKISTKQSDRDLIDTIIDICKRADNNSQISKAVIAKYGYPKWDLTITLSNANGLKSLFVPVVDSSNQVQLLILAHQDSKEHVVFKFITKNTPQPRLPLGTSDGKTFTNESLVGIFNVLDKRVTALRAQSNSSSENVKTNGGVTVIETCWYYSWTDAEGGVYVTNTQCSYKVLFSGYKDITAAQNLEPFLEGGGGGPPADPNPCANAEKEALNQLEQQFNEYIEDQTPNNYPIYATQIDLKPYHEIIDWTIVEGSINHWKVTATTVIDLSYDDFPRSYNRTLALQSKGSRYEGANNFIISTWTPSTPEIRINSNHTRFPSGIVTESGSLNHRMKGQLKVNTPCGEFTFSPGFEDTRRHTGTLTIISQ